MQDYIDVGLMSMGAWMMGVGVDRFICDNPCKPQLIETPGGTMLCTVTYSKEEFQSYQVRKIAFLAFGMGCFLYGANSFFLEDKR